jgi:SNF2 family DNA or RNA helicase
MGLTGTPAPNGLLDLWPQLYLLDQGARLGPTVTGYRSEYFSAAATMGMVVIKYAIKKGAAEKIYKLIGDICISMKAEDYLELPERLDQVYPVAIPEALRARYEKFEEEEVMKVAGGMITAVNAPALATKLLQFTSGAVYDEQKKAHWIHDHKLDGLEDVYEAALGDPLIVFYWYQHELTRILKRFPEAQELKGEQDIDRWNRGEIPMLVIHPASAGHGLNLQHGGHRILWFTLPYWNLELYQQAVARIDRQGQTQVVTNQILAISDTVETEMATALAAKDRTQELLIRALRAKYKGGRDEA